MANSNDFSKLRQDLLNKLSFDSFEWIDVTLTGGIVIKVCKAVKIDGLFIPVTAAETREIARKYLVYPLTRAVADQVMNQAAFVSYQGQYPEMLNFKKSSEYLNSNNYDGVRKFGAHKLWLLSSRGRAINYGFYEATGSKTSTGGGLLLKAGFNLRQSLGAKHDGNHWDYSQLLQLMYASKPLEIGGASYSLSMALIQGLPVVWDESQKLKQADLP
jgi:hypothetical protein